MDNAITHDKETDTFYFACPHCRLMCQVPRGLIRCTIFRHAVYKKSFMFVDPHASKAKCESWVANDEVFGCGKPFIFDGHKVEICDYI